MNTNPLIKYLNRLLVMAFCFALFIPLITGIINKDGTQSRYEKRNLNQLPILPTTMGEIGKYPLKFNHYYADQFGMRNGLIKNYNLTKLFIGDSSSQDVTKGKDGWLFLGSIAPNYKRNGDPFGDYRNVNQYTDKDLKNITKRLVGKSLWLKNKGIEYLFFIAPNKHSIYYDKFPEYIKKINNTSAFEQLMDYLASETSVNTLDLKEDLIAQKHAKQLYYKTDTHWNHHATNIVQFELLNTIKLMFPSIDSPVLYDLKSVMKKGGDLGGLLGVYGLPKYDPQPVFNHSCTPIVTPLNAKLREIQTHQCEGQSLTALVYRDSFFSSLAPYFSRKFKATTYLYSKSNYASLTEQIKINKPDIVVEEWVERHLPYSPKDSPVFINYLNKYLFDESQEVLFNNQWNKLNLSSNLIHEIKNYADFSIKSVSKDPQIEVRSIDFNADNNYVMNIQFNSTVKSRMKLYYKLSTSIKRNYNEKRTQSFHVKKGKNNLYFSLDQKNLSPLFRLDPMHDKGEIQISSMVIKKVKKLNEL